MNNGDFFGIPAAALPGIANELYTVNYNIVASSALLFWDILLVFDREVQYIWKNEFSLVAVLFGVIRLLAVAVQVVALALDVGTRRVSPSVCRALIWYQATLGLSMSTCVDILLIWRVYAFYGRNKKLLISLCIFETMAFAAALSTLIVALPQVQVAPNPFPNHLRIGSCVISNVSTLSSDIWIPILSVQTVLFGLAAGRCVYLQWTSPSSLSTVYFTFVRDGIWTFLVLFIIYLLCIIGNSTNSILGLIALYWCFPLIGTCASRLILNLRSANGQRHDYSLDASHRTSTKVNFGGGVMGAYVNVAYDSTQDSHEDTFS